MARKVAIRKVRFGIRLKISIIMILGIAFASALIGLAVYNQHESKIKDTILRLSGTILKGAAEDAEQYLRLTQYLDKAKDLKPRQRAAVVKAIGESQKSMAGYFSSIIKKEEILDIAFLVDVDWRDVNVNWNRRDRARYRYFSRQNGSFFELDLYTSDGRPIRGSRGRDDAQLKPTVFSYYMQNMDTSSYLAFSESRKNDGKKFVIVGIPLFSDRKDAAIYDGYRDFRRTRVMSGEDLKKFKARRQEYRDLFLGRIVERGSGVEYDLVVDTDRKKRLVLDNLIGAVDMKPLSYEKLADFRKGFSDMFNESVEGGRVPLFRLRILLASMMKDYGLALKEPLAGEDLWKNVYRHARRNSVSVETLYGVDDLALMSFRMDLSGVLGIFLLRDSFYAEMEKNRKDILNLILSIFLRATIIALFFPTFIIRNVASLEEAALDIGKGNLSRRIEMKGSDELGRLADIINLMSANLEKAQKEMLEKQRMKAELNTAQQIQSALLPDGFPDIRGLSFGAYYMAQTESGGDYYDFIPMGEGRLGLAMADVSGHGVASGLVMAMTRTLLHIHCEKNGDTKKILEMINDYLYANTASNYFVTMFFGVLDVKSLQLRFSSAGHCHALVMRNGRIQEVPAGGIALGAVATDSISRLIESKTLQLQKGDYFIQYTDGVYESFNAANEEYGLERFHRALLDGFGKDPQEIVNHVVRSVDAFTGRVPQHDDITFFIIRAG
ncbi:MAG TPA: PP2C family protein-serine/threonine phosphatase [Spirochaetota bacterium]|nr:PP2C family protein-serine/threonine phosphatase [Spirochaetota bacterium]